MNVKISEIFGPRCITAQGGQKLFEYLKNSLEKGELIELDFEGVEIFASPFFNYSIGQIYSSDSLIESSKLIKFSGLNDVGKIIVEKVIQNSLMHRQGFDVSGLISKNLD